MKDGLGSVQSALILGGGSDIGLATACALAKDRTRTFVLAARKPERLQPAADGLRAMGAGEVHLVEFDAGEFERHGDVVEEAFRLAGDLDLAVLTFGVLGDQRVAERDPVAALEIARTNYLGAVSVLIPLAERMRAQGHGTIAVLSSVAGERARRSNFVYGSSKAGLDVFCQGLRDRLDGTGVDVLIVRPGFVRTKMTVGLSAPPLATRPEAVARAILEGVRRGGGGVIWVPPELRFVMSGLRHLPRSVFRRLPI